MPADETFPGVYVEEFSGVAPPITSVSTSVTAFIGRARLGSTNEPTTIKSFADFERLFGGLSRDYPMGYAVHDFYLNGGTSAIIVSVSSSRSPGILTTAGIASDAQEMDKTGLYALDRADLFNLMCIPPDTIRGTIDPAIYQAAMRYCASRRAFLIVDPPACWGTDLHGAAEAARHGLGELGLTGIDAQNAALYFPRVIQADPTRNGQPDIFAPCGIIAGVIARTDSNRGVWKAPAGSEAIIEGVQGLHINLSDAELGMLNPLGINCLRQLSVHGSVVWGARTLAGADAGAEEFKYIPVRRLALFIEESVSRGLKWVVFEPNGQALWERIRQSVSEFMRNLWRQGAFQGAKPEDAFFVKCDNSTNTLDDINNGRINILVGFAPLKPAEFVILKLELRASVT